MMKYSNIILYVLGIAAIGLLSTCSSNNDYDGDAPLSAYDLPIRFEVSSVNGMETRAGAADTYDTSLPVNSEIGVYIYDSDNIDISTKQPVDSSPSTTWVYQVAGSVGSDGYAPLRLTSHTKNPRFPLKNDTEYKDNVRVFAVYPNNTAFKPSGNSATSYKFTVENDQTTETAVKASDLLASDVVAYTAPQCESRLSILLKHRMAKVTVVFQPKTGSDLTSSNMPSTFDIYNVYRSLTITPSEAPATGAVSGGDADMVLETSPMKGCTAHSFFIPPQTITANTPILKFNVLPNEATADFPTFLGINGCTFAPAANTTFEAGKQYLITVTVDVDFATMTGTITPWTNGGKIVYTAYEDSIM